MTPGDKFRQAVGNERPLKVVGTINAYTARMAQATGYRAIYLSGGGVAANSLGMPDLGISNLDDVLIDVRRITDVCDLPLLVDVDTGFGSSAFNVARTARSLIKAGAGAWVTIDEGNAAMRMIVGFAPGRSDVYLAVMHSGVTLGPLVGRLAAQADVLVVNHALLLADLALRRQTDNYTAAAVLPPFDRLVLDGRFRVDALVTDRRFRALTQPRIGEHVAVEREDLRFLVPALLGNQPMASAQFLIRLIDRFQQAHAPLVGGRRGHGHLPGVAGGA